MQAPRNVALLLLCSMQVAAVLRGAGTQSGKVMADMRPEVVSQLLVSVEKKWTQGKLMFLNNQTDDASAFATMKASCVKVVTSVVQGSDGDKDRVVDYMNQVCAEKNTANNAAMCTELSKGIESVMSDDVEYNRDELEVGKFCQKFWDGAVTSAAQEEKKRLDEREARLAQEEKKQDEELKAQAKLSAHPAPVKVATKNATVKTEVKNQTVATVEDVAAKTEVTNQTVAAVEVPHVEEPKAAVTENSTAVAVAVPTVNTTVAEEQTNVVAAVTNSTVEPKVNATVDTAPVEPKVNATVDTAANTTAPAEPKVAMMAIHGNAPNKTSAAVQQKNTSTPVAPKK